MTFDQIRLKTKTEIAAFGMILLGVLSLVFTAMLIFLSGSGEWNRILYQLFGVATLYFFSRMLKQSFAGWCFAVVFLILPIIVNFIYAKADIRNPINVFFLLAEFIILLLIFLDRKRHFAVLKETFANQRENGRSFNEIQITKKARFAQAVAVIMFLFLGYGFLGIVDSFGYSLMFFGLVYMVVQSVVYFFLWLGYGFTVYYLGKVKIIGLYFGLATFGATIFMGFIMPLGTGLGAVVLLPIALVNILAFVLLLFDTLNNHFYRRGKSKI